MSYIMTPYDTALEEILSDGTWRTNQRTGLRTLSICNLTRRYRIDDHFPLLTKRKMFPKSVFAELLWIISGSTNNNDLKKLGANFWVDQEFEKKHGYIPGSLGPVYGFQLRHFGGTYAEGDPTRIEFAGGEKGEYHSYGDEGFDQLQYVMDEIKKNPSSRRIMFSLWNPKQLHMQKLPPCHFCYAAHIDDAGNFSGTLLQRSGDFPVGIPSNIQFYSALTMMIAQQTGYNARQLTHTVIDAHIYENQIDAVKEYLGRPETPSPKLTIHKANDIYSYSLSDFEVQDYNPQGIIKIPVAV